MLPFHTFEFAVRGSQTVKIELTLPASITRRRLVCAHGIHSLAAASLAALGACWPANQGVPDWTASMGNPGIFAERVGDWLHEQGYDDNQVTECGVLCLGRMAASMEGYGGADEQDPTTGQG